MCDNINSLREAQVCSMTELNTPTACWLRLVQQASQVTQAQALQIKATDACMKTCTLAPKQRRRIWNFARKGVKSIASRPHRYAPNNRDVGGPTWKRPRTRLADSPKQIHPNPETQRLISCLDASKTHGEMQADALIGSVSRHPPNLMQQNTDQQRMIMQAGA